MRWSDRHVRRLASVFGHGASDLFSEPAVSRRFKICDCLCCGESFQSEGAHNRMCDECRELPKPFGFGHEMRLPVKKRARLFGDDDG